ncbi:MAG: hypothetical protein LPK18_00765 [Pseudomonadaceae bacterium]|nr:hypothetical protein [Pseudomonadaceae bacterium]
MTRLQPTIDLSYGEQEVLKRILGEPQAIANALAPNDARENSRIVGLLEQLAEAFAPEYFKQHDYSEPEQDQPDSGMSR